MQPSHFQLLLQIKKRSIMIRPIELLIALFLLAGSQPLVAFAQPNQTKVLEIAKGVFFRKAQTEPTFTGCNQGWVVFQDFVLVIDANFPGQVKEVVEAIRKTTDKPIRFVFDTHYHGDHADGNIKYVEIGATVLAHERSQPLFQTKGLSAFEKAASSSDRAKEYGSLKYGIPSMFFTHKLIFDDGEQRVELIFLGHAHTSGDAVAWLPKHGILFTGDACVNGPFNYTGDSNTESWIQVLSAMKDLGVKQVAPGHGELSDSSLIDQQQRYFVELRQEIRKGLDAGQSIDQVKQSIDIPFYREWSGVEAKTRTENIEHVYKELTGPRQPLEKTISFQRWSSKWEHRFDDPNPGQESKERIQKDARFTELAELYLKSDSERRRQIREYFRARSHEWPQMASFIERQAKRIQSSTDVECVRQALAIAAIEGGMDDYLNTMKSLARLRAASEEKRIDIDPLLRQIQAPEFISPENKLLFEGVRTLSPGELLAVQQDGTLIPN